MNGYGCSNPWILSKLVNWYKVDEIESEIGGHKDRRSGLLATDGCDMKSFDSSKGKEFVFVRLAHFLFRNRLSVVL